MGRGWIYSAGVWEGTLGCKTRMQLWTLWQSVQHESEIGNTHVQLPPWDQPPSLLLVSNFYCENCGRGFTSKEKFTTHVTALHQEKPFSSLNIFYCLKLSLGTVVLHMHLVLTPICVVWPSCQRQNIATVNTDVFWHGLLNVKDLQKSFNHFLKSKLLSDIYIYSMV